MRSILLLSTLVFCGMTSAQDQPLIIKGSKAEVEMAVRQMQLLEEAKMAQARMNWASSSTVWGFGHGGSQLIDYLYSDHMRKQMEFTDAQNKQFKELRKDFQTAYSQVLKEFPELKDKNLPQKARSEINRKVYLAQNKLRKEFSEKVKDTLIPRQLAMVKTLKFKSNVQAFGFAHAITNAPFNEELKVSDKQKKEISKIRSESQAAIQKKIAEMKAEAKKEMLKVLDAKQRKVIKELEGEDTK